MVMPGMSFGTRNMDMDLLSWSGLSSLPMNMMNGAVSAWLTMVFVPFRVTVPSPFHVQVEIIDMLSEPAQGSERARLKHCSPVLA